MPKKIKIKRSLNPPRPPGHIDMPEVSVGDEFVLTLENNVQQHIRISQVFPPNDTGAQYADQRSFYYEILDQGKKVFGYMIEEHFLKVATPR